MIRYGALSRAGWAIATLLTGGAVGAALWLQVSPACACASPLKSWVGSLGLAQVAFYQDQGRFATSIAELQPLVGMVERERLGKTYDLSLGQAGTTAWIAGQHRITPEPTPQLRGRMLLGDPQARQLPSDYRIELAIAPTGQVQRQDCELPRVWTGHPLGTSLRAQTLAPRCQAR